MPVELEETLDRILIILKAIKDQPLSQSDLARKTAINYNTLRRLIEVLENKKLVTKTIDPGPPRQVIIKPTPKGQCIIQCLTQR